MTTLNVPTLRDMYLANKTAIIRCGFDVPVDRDGSILDDYRIRASAPTINYLLEQGIKKIIIITHLGRPENNESNLTTFKVALKLGDILGQDIAYVDNWGNEELPDNKIVMLENLRFNPAEKSKDPIKRNEFGKHLANLADIYINDAFSVSHRDHASMTSIPKYIPGCIGLNVEHEIKTINDSLEQPERPFISIIGGVKADKLSAISNLLDKADKILVAGALGFTILKYFGNDVGKSKTDMDGLENFKDILAKIKDNPKVWLPTDAVISTNFSNDSKSSVVNCDAIPSESMALDIGPNTIKSYTKEILDAKTIIWNGPIGVFEFEKFANGTIEIAKAIGNNKNNNCVTIVGGGDSASAVNKLKLTESFTLVSSGGGASLKLFEGKTLIAIEVLKKFKD